MRDKRIRLGKRHIIEARNITVTDDVSMTGCENLMGADFRNATIRGDFLMLKQIEVQSVDHAPNIVAVRPAKRPRGRINLEGAEIAGNCNLMFDGGMISESGEVHTAETAVVGVGPSIEAKLARIGGELLIAGHPSPQLTNAGQSGQPDNNHNVLLHTPALIKANDELVKADWLAAERASARSDQAGSLHTWLDERRAHPKIDLANARAALFTHMPNAWPRLDRLDIVGFRYERAGRFGSLAPLPYVPGTSPAIDTRPRNRRRVGYAFFAIVVFLGLSLGFLAGLDELVGASNLFWTILIFLLLAAQLGLPILTRPFRRHSRPIGLSWLRLQRLARNDSRVQDGRVAGWRGRLPRGPNGQTVAQWPAKSPRGSVYQSLEPYTIAARALREEGRWISANRIEQRRLEVRTGQLSWRLHLFEKVGFSLIGASARYGFSYVRMFFLSAFLLLGTAMIAHNANQRGLMQHKLVKVELHPAAGLNDAQLAYSAKFGHRGHVALDLNIGGAPAGDAAACDKPGGRCEEFNSLAFARDLVLPAVSSGADEEWEAKPGVAVPWLSWLPFTLRELFDVAHLLGLGFFGLLLLGVSARISLLINRYSE